MQPAAHYSNAIYGMTLHCTAPHCAALLHTAPQASLDHPNVVKFEEFFWGAELGMFMEFCRAGP